MVLIFQSAPGDTSNSIATSGSPLAVHNEECIKHSRVKEGCTSTTTTRGISEIQYLDSRRSWRQFKTLPAMLKRTTSPGVQLFWVLPSASVLNCMGNTHPLIFPAILSRRFNRVLKLKIKTQCCKCKQLHPSTGLQGIPGRQVPCMCCSDQHNIYSRGWQVR
jgi:hypothetical protein